MAGVRTWTASKTCPVHIQYYTCSLENATAGIDWPQII